MSAGAARNGAQPEPGLLPAGILAALVHVVFLALLIFGFSWKTAPPQGMVVDLWSSLPQPAQPVRPVQPVQPPEPVQPVKPQVAEKPEPKLPPPVEKPPPAPKPEPARQVTPPKPEIALNEKVEKPKPVEKKQPAQDQQKTRIAAEIAQLQREQDVLEKQLAQQAAARAAAQARLQDELAEYKAKILAKIKSRIVLPPNLPGDPAVEFSVTLLPGGDVLEVKLRRSSGYAAFDSAVERAIFLARPLPLPPDPALFREFRDLSLTVHYRE